MSTKLDILFVNPGNQKAIYQDLAKDYSAIETPTWALLLAQSVRTLGYETGIFDVNAEKLATKQAVQRIKKTNSRLICFVVYGQNPNSGTVNMSGATALANAVKEAGIEIPICFVGSHVSALPLEVLDKYNIQAEPESSNELCILSGVVANFDVHATEMMAILAALEIFRHSVFETGQSIVFYTDSLLSKKVLGDKRLPPGTKKYSGIKKMFKKIIDLNALDVNVKKVAAHAGIELNEIADQVAKNRLFP